jgi:hypothetical protein
MQPQKEAKSIIIANLIKNLTTTDFIKQKIKIKTKSLYAINLIIQNINLHEIRFKRILLNYDEKKVVVESEKIFLKRKTKLY